MNTLKQSIGFIGAGNMARAILKGMISSSLIQPGQAIASDAIATQVEELVAQTGARPGASNVEVAKAADVIIFATKPYQVADVCAEIREHTRPTSSLYPSAPECVPQKLKTHFPQTPRLFGSCRILPP